MVKKLMTSRSVLVVVAAMLLMAATSCRIEPPLKLADNRDIDIRMNDVEVSLETIWDVDTDWQRNWWYGWDDVDVANWGRLEYPEPSSFEVRGYFKGKIPTGETLNYSAFTAWEPRFRRHFYLGYHDLVFWSHIMSPDGTQVVIFDESDIHSINATTSRSRLSYVPPVSRGAEVFHNPEIFYSSQEEDFYVSDDPADYDYYDEENEVWVKRLHTRLGPMVYTYLVQVVIYNNRGRVTGIADDATISALADGVNLHTGITSNKDIIVSYPMRTKRDLPARDGRHADIIGGRMTTFGLCGMQPWSKSRASRYEGSRGDLRNSLMVDFTFANSSDSVYTFDITRQLQSQAHGGVVTIEIDADTLVIPRRGSTAGGFNATIVPQDSITFDFGM